MTHDNFPLPYPVMVRHFAALGIAAPPSALARTTIHDALAADASAAFSWETTMAAAALQAGLDPLQSGQLARRLMEHFFGVTSSWLSDAEKAVSGTLPHPRPSGMLEGAIREQLRETCRPEERTEAEHHAASTSTIPGASLEGGGPAEQEQPAPSATERLAHALRRSTPGAWEPAPGVLYCIACGGSGHRSNACPRRKE